MGSMPFHRLILLAALLTLAACDGTGREDRETPAPGVRDDAGSGSSDDYGADDVHGPGDVAHSSRIPDQIVFRDADLSVNEETVSSEVVRPREDIAVLCTPTGTEDLHCDGVDEDCDGLTDEDHTPRTTSCGIGACFAEGEERCEAGVLIDSCVAGTPQQEDASCDASDDDCDGQTDEDFVPLTTSCGRGACAAEGELTCHEGMTVDSCEPLAPESMDATCDAVDDDCDGETDEDFPGQATACGLGECLQTGVVLCHNGREIDTCETGPPRAESCNELDDDCDGATDEDFALGSGCPAIGECERATLACTLDGSGTRCVQEGVEGERCDDLDNDCDGETDESLGSIPCGLGSCQREIAACEGGLAVECDAFLGAQDETCNGFDDDCDGQTDEDLEGCCLAREDLPEQGTEGYGQCAGTDIWVCEDDEWRLRQECGAVDDICVDDGAGHAVCGDPGTVCEGCESMLGHYCTAMNTCQLFGVSVEPGEIYATEDWCVFKVYTPEHPDPSVSGPLELEFVGCQSRSLHESVGSLQLWGQYVHETGVLEATADAGFASCSIQMTQAACQ